MIIVTVLNIKKGQCGKESLKKFPGVQTASVENVYTVDKMEEIIPSIHSYIREKIEGEYNRNKEYNRIFLENDKQSYIFEWFSEVYNYSV
ncbi:MAG: hypothetical protein H2212_02925 [Ruminococcus sp.]|nr:hypothetical protein [Ruminococcus sp.]